MHSLDRDDIHITGLVKGEERYLWIFTDANRAEVFKSLGRAASNPELSLSWFDAAVLSQQVRATEERCVGR